MMVYLLKKVVQVMEVLSVFGIMIIQNIFIFNQLHSGHHLLLNQGLLELIVTIMCMFVSPHLTVPGPELTQMH